MFHDKALKKAEQIFKRFEYELLFGIPEADKQKRKYRQQFKSNLKMAYIKQGKTIFMAWVDKVTNKAYRNDSYYYYKQTNEEIKNFEFIRWLNVMDV